MTDLEPPVASLSRRRSFQESFCALALAVATILTAWCGFQAADQSAKQADLGSEAAATRIGSARSTTHAAAEAEIDVNLWTRWLDAVLAERAIDPTRSFTPDGRYMPSRGTTSDFYYRRFRTEFRPAFNAWIARRPFNDTTAPPVPFALPEYKVHDATLADQQAARAEHLDQRSTDAGAVARDYIFLTVLFAATLALAGLAIRFRGARQREATIAVALIFLLGGIGIAATLPVNL